MARPKSESKRIALLKAATEVVAARGIGAPTAQIAKLAAVAEGTLFRYFPTKDDLLNELYLFLKRDLADAIIQFNNTALSTQEIAQIIWNKYIDWAIQNPLASSAINQLTVSELIQPETREQTKAFFPSIDGIFDFCATSQTHHEDSAAFGNAIFSALANVTIEFVTKNPEQSTLYKDNGFYAMWRALTQR